MCLCMAQRAVCKFNDPLGSIKLKGDKAARYTYRPFHSITHIAYIHYIRKYIYIQYAGYTGYCWVSFAGSSAILLALDVHLYTQSIYVYIKYRIYFQKFVQYMYTFLKGFRIYKSFFNMFIYKYTYTNDTHYNGIIEEILSLICRFVIYLCSDTQRINNKYIFRI